jgi:hypothetical protein
MSYKFAILAFFSWGTARADVVTALNKADTLSQCVAPDPVAVHRFKAHCKETILRGGSTSEMSYNELGLRDRDYSGKPAPGWKRVLFVGSSTMAAPGLPESGTPPRRLEALLRKTSKKVEVINAGVEGYAALQFAATVGRELAAYHPTHTVVVVDLGFSMNTDTLNEPSVTATPTGAIAITPGLLPWLQRAGEWIGLTTMSPNGYEAYRRLFTIQGMGYRAWNTLRCRITSRHEPAFSSCMLAPTLRGLLSVKEQVEAAGSKLLLLYSGSNFSNDIHISPAYDLEVARRFDSLTPPVLVSGDPVGEALAAAGTNAVSFRMPRGPGYFLPADIHFSAAGADAFAQAIEARVREFLAN